MEREHLLEIIEESIERFKKGPRRYEPGYPMESKREFEARASRWRSHLLNFIKLCQTQANLMEKKNGPST